jgi:hypothetical protein
MRTAHFSIITQQAVVTSYRRFGTTYLVPFSGSLRNNREQRGSQEITITVSLLRYKLTVQINNYKTYTTLIC